jgi:hypothetical protein
MNTLLLANSVDVTSLTDKYLLFGYLSYYDKKLYLAVEEKRREEILKPAHETDEPEVWYAKLKRNLKTLEINETEQGHKFRIMESWKNHSLWNETASADKNLPRYTSGSEIIGELQKQFNFRVSNQTLDLLRPGDFPVIKKTSIHPPAGEEDGSTHTEIRLGGRHAPKNTKGLCFKCVKSNGYHETAHENDFVCFQKPVTGCRTGLEGLYASIERSFRPTQEKGPP